MDNPIISMFSSVKTTTGESIELYEFLDGIRKGRWQDLVLAIRATNDDDKKAQLKKKLPAVTVSGYFDKRAAKDIRHHSGFIAMDIDNVTNPEEVKDVLRTDAYCYSAFTSVSGKGVCAIFRIDGSRHEDAFRGLDEYLYSNYGLICDKHCVDVSRLRIVSFDPYMHINENARIFKKYPPKPRARKQPPKVVFVDSDFARIVNELYSRGINICEEYGEWLRVCYAIVSEYGDSNEGRTYFDLLSRLSSKYNENDCMRQYDVCLRHHSDQKQKVSTINYIYWQAKNNGIDIYSERTKEIIRAASAQHKNGISAVDIAIGLKKHQDIPEAESMPIIEQVVNNGVEYQSENIIDDIWSFLQQYNLRKNLVTRNVEINGKPIDDSDINTIFIDCKALYDKATKDLVCSIIFSNKVEQYNPIREYFEANHVVDTSYPNLTRLLDSVVTDTPNYRKWITKWLVSIVASSYGTYSPLVLVFSGRKQGTGKTHFFRYLLPKQLRYLFAESKMDNGKDDEILMTKKLIILDDEYGGKSKREEKKLKEITAKEFINVREPYGRVSVDLRRLAVFCGTTNEDQILSDFTGNRRVMPINVLDIDHKSYNDCDKVQLWYELYHLYKSGYDFTVLRDEIKELNESTEAFTMSTPEEDLVAAKLRPGTTGIGEWMNITQIINYLTYDNNQRLSNTRVGMVLTKSGYEKKRMWMNGNTVTAFFVDKISNDRDVPPAPESYPF